MNDDRELLKLAAKAAGLEVHWGQGWQSEMLFREISRPSSPLVSNVEWTPLTDRSDANALQEKLRMDVVWLYWSKKWQASIDGEGGVGKAYCDPDMNRAITLCAAEIGRRMK